MRVSGLRKKLNLNNEWNRNFVLGYTDEETVMLDFDNTSFKTVRYWASRAMKWFRLQGYLILKSSPNNYHVVFNRKVTWKENMRIVTWVVLHSKNLMLLKWFIMQCIKQGSTLRISPKRDKRSPRIVLRHGKQEKQIRDFLEYRKVVKNIVRKMRAEQICVT